MVIFFFPLRKNQVCPVIINRISNVFFIRYIGFIMVRLNFVNIFCEIENFEESQC